MRVDWRRSTSLPLSVAILVTASLLVTDARSAIAQIRVNPTGAAINVQGATTVFLTFGGLRNQVPAEASWCGELMPATPDLGVKCDPRSLFGQLPAGLGPSRLGSAGTFSDIMSVPPSVARRAYLAAGSEPATFFYVRRFVSTTGGPDEYVAVTCRPTGGGARSPLSLTAVTITFDVETPVLHIASGEVPPRFGATLNYTGTGRLKGRWEVVRPGEPLPDTRDLLTEATLTPEERGTQRRYGELARFNVFLPPAGRVTLPGPDPEALPTALAGTYLILLRVEASDDKEGDSNPVAAGGSGGLLHNGAVAGFPLPALRYVVGSGSSALASTLGSSVPSPLEPADDAQLASGVVEFHWVPSPRALFHRLEVVTYDDASVLEAYTPVGVARYRTPPWLAERASGRPLRWRVVALDADGDVVGRSRWRSFRFVDGQPPAS